MISRALTEKDLELDEKKVFGAIINLWCLGNPQDPYAHSTESRVIRDSLKAGLAREKIEDVLDTLESRNLISRTDEDGQKRIKYRAESEHIVKELQKTTYVESRFQFKPPRH